MAIARWTPFGAFASLQREMQEMLDRLSTRPIFEGFSFRPATDIFREGEELVIKAELPGIDPKEELEIDADGTVLHIRGKKRVEKEIDEKDRYLRECRFGTFSRDVMLPEGVEIDKIGARYEDGILTVRVPLPTEVIEEGKKTTIPISVSETV